MKFVKLTTILAIVLACLTLMSINVNAMPKVSAKPESTVTTEVNQKSVKIDINAANAEQLASLPGLGKKKAQAIINYRKLNGKFKDVKELVNVKGIGPKLSAKILPLVKIKPEAKES